MDYQEEYKKMMASRQQNMLNQHNMQSNAYNNSYANQMASIQRNILNEMDLRNMPMNELQNIMLAMDQEHERRTMDVPLPSPTRRELSKNEALRNAWEAFEIVWKLSKK